MRANLHFESSGRNSSGVNGPSSTNEAVNGQGNTAAIQEGFMRIGSEEGDEDLITKDGQEDVSISARASVRSAVKNGGSHVRSTFWKEGNTNGDVSVGFRLKEINAHCESKDDCKDGNIYEDDFLKAGTEENSEHLLRKDGREDEVLQSMEETYETDVFCENGSDDVDGKSDYNSFNGSDGDEVGSSFEQRTQSKSSQRGSKHSSNQEWLSQNTENEVFCGASDWGEYLHEHEGDMTGSTELWEALKEQDAGHDQVDVPIGREEVNGNEHAELEDELEVNCLPGAIAQVRGTGRPDLDDGEDDFGIAEDRLIPQNLKSALKHSCQNSGIGRPDLEEDDVISDVGVTQEPNLHGSCSGMPRVRKEPLGETTDDFFELHGEIDEHAQDELRSSFTTRSSEHKGAVIKLENDVLLEGKGADEPNFSKDSPSNTTKPVNVSETHTTKASLGMKSQASGDQAKQTGAGTSSALTLIPEKNMQGNVHTRQHDRSHEPGEEDYFQAATVSQIVGDGLRKKGCIIRLGSKEAEELLQMEFAKVGRAVSNQKELSPKCSTIHNYKNACVDWTGEELGPDELSRYVEALEVKETYIDTVLDMEDVLFDAEEGTGARVFQVGKSLTLGAGRPTRDGSLSASTSNESSSVLRQVGGLACNLTEADWVEVVGALQQRGGASLGDRVVGVKEHTIYRIKVHGGGNEWEIHRRYRDFVVLYNQLLQLFAGKGNVQLPTPWGKVKPESRKFFGNTSPSVVEVRSALIQVCLQSLLQAGSPLSTATPLLRFLFPDGEISPSIKTGWQHSQKHSGESQCGLHVLLEDFPDSELDSPKSDMLSSKAEQDQSDGRHTSVFGKTIRLIVQINKKKSLKQQLQAQHYTCAGCYKHLELALGLVPEIVQNWGWSGPRFCDYSGQLFCSTCHLNEIAVIPAWVLQQWDFAPGHVSQLAKAYLDSIYDKPMLCVSAVNPYLYARVPVLAHLTEIRRNLSKMLACIRCSARTRFQAMMGSRRYLLENNDFFALRDLADLSKGAFAVLPGYMRAMLLKLSIHITRECTACQDLGEACGAGELCNDPFDVIFPYQDKSITRCQSCHLPYHKRCFLKCQKHCSCRKGQSVQGLKDSPYRNDALHSQLDAEPSLRTDLLSSLALGRNSSPANSSVTVGENKAKAKKNFLASFLGAKENQCSESQIEKHNSVVLNMSALLSPLEL